jgi:hypothetical protein
MPAQGKKTQKASPPAQADTMYPVIESFVEKATEAQVSQMFAHIKEDVGSLKGPAKEKGKKALAALEGTEELLMHLLIVRQNLINELNSSAKGKK